MSENQVKKSQSNVASPYPLRRRMGRYKNNQEQIQQPYDEMQFYALWNEIKDHAAWDAKMKDQVTNEAHVTNVGNPVRQLHALKEQYSRTLPSDIKDEDKRECNFVPLSFKEEI